MGTGSKVVAGAFALLLVSGCGAIADKAGEKIGEKVAESATGCENIDVSDKGVSAECDGNSVSVDSDGNVTSSDEDGNSGSFETGSELPEDWPAELDPPDGTKVLVSSTNTVNGKRSWFAVAAVPGEVADLASGLRDQLTERRIHHRERVDEQCRGYRRGDHQCQ